MAKNKKKLRKKLRNELIQKSIESSSVTQTNNSSITGPNAIQKPIEEDAVIDYSSNNIENPKNDHSLALSTVKIIKKEVLMILILFLILISLMIAGKYLDHTQNWVLTFANLLFSKF